MTSGASPAATPSRSPMSGSIKCSRRSITRISGPPPCSRAAAWALWVSAFPPPSAQNSANPLRQIWAIVGDGGFQMTLCEMATAVQENVNVNIAIINNNFLGMVRQWQELFFEKRYPGDAYGQSRLLQIGGRPTAYPIVWSRNGSRSRMPCSTRGALTDLPSSNFVVEKEEMVYPDGPRRRGLARYETPAPSQEKHDGCNKSGKQNDRGRPGLKTNRAS